MWSMKLNVGQVRVAGILLTGISACVCVYFLTRMMEPRDVPTLRFSVGPTATTRFEIGKFLTEQAALFGVRLQMFESNGTIECLEAIKEKKLDVAFVNSGVSIPDDQDIQVLGVLGLEPYHIFTRDKLSEGMTLREWLKGKSIGMGHRKSTEYLFAKEMLEFAELSLVENDSADYVKPIEFKKSQLVESLEAIKKATGDEKQALIAKLPDCLIIQGMLPSAIADLVTEATSYQLVPLKASAAFKLDALHGAHATEPTLERRFLELDTIPMNTYLSNVPIPAVDYQTVASRVLVVARRDLPVDAVKQLTRSLFEGEFRSRMLPASPRDLATPYEIHAGAIAYLDRDKPVAFDQVMEGVNKVFSVLGAITAGALSLYGFLWKAKGRKPKDYFAEIRSMEKLTQVDEIKDLPSDRLEELFRGIDSRLLNLRRDLVEDICEGRLGSDQAIANIIALLQDYRKSLAMNLRMSESSNANQASILSTKESNEGMARDGMRRAA